MTETATPAPPDELAGVSLVDPAMASEPFGYFETLVEQAPVLWNTRMKAWLVSRYDDVTAALRDERFGSDRVGPYLQSRVPTEDRERLQSMFDTLGRWLVFLAPAGPHPSAWAGAQVVHTASGPHLAG